MGTPVRYEFVVEGETAHAIVAAAHAEAGRFFEFFGGSPYTLSIDAVERSQRTVDGGVIARLIEATVTAMKAIP